VEELSETEKAQAVANASQDTADGNQFNGGIKKIKTEMNYVGFQRRLVAWIIDVFALIPLLTGTGYAVYEYLKSASSYEFVDAQVGAFWVYMSFGFIISLFNIGFWSWRGQTPGKMVMRMRIVKYDGSCIGIGRAILRYIGIIIPIIAIMIACFIISIFSPNIAGGVLLYIGIPLGPFLVFLPFFFIIWDRKKQGLHDKLARTYVINTRHVREPESLNKKTIDNDS